MGLCIDPDENKQSVQVEVRRDSVIVTEADWDKDTDDEVITSAEFSKEYLRRLMEFFRENPQHLE